MGIGARLVQECVQFAERAGYAAMTLWTQSILQDACRLYERAGFTLAERAAAPQLRPRPGRPDVVAAAQSPESYLNEIASRTR